MIFGAQEEVFTIWRSWFQAFCKRIRKISHRPRSSYDSTAYLDFHDSQNGWSHRLRRVFQFRKKRQTSTGLHFVADMSNGSYDEGDEKRLPSVPVHFLPSTIPISLSQGIQITVKTSQESSYDTDTSLRPPPRQARSVNESPTTHVLDSHPFRTMPSLTALGNENHSMASDVIEISGESVVQLTEREGEKGGKRYEKLLLRPNTGESSRTFGN